MSLRTIRVLLFSAVFAFGWAALKAGAERKGFPHETHDGLFPTCNSCHAGIPEQDAATLYTVTPENCAACHDGDQIDRVDWSGPVRVPGNLKFDHRLHVTEQGIECADCHQIPDSKSRMAIQVPGPDVCFSCHEATSHMVDGECASCHLPAAAVASFTAEKIAALPKPEDHDDEAFLWKHGPAASASVERCAVCHGRETCERCHLNAAGVAPVGELESDARFAVQAAGIESRWPKPDTHDAAWPQNHGQAALSSIQECANCHVQKSCTGCHADRPPAGLTLLPVSGPDGPRGVELAGARPPGHDADFYFQHGARAAAKGQTCMSCHDPATCENCHAGASKPGFHPPDYIFRHRSEAYARDLDCANCHSSETFCRACHESSGASSKDARSTAYHDANPLWLLSHGNAARQGLDNCAGCHQQSDCLRCHSAKTGWRVNPHGPGFDPERVGDRSLVLCASCHFSDPRPH